MVTKIPRFTFEKFPDADPTLTSSMKSVGEAMAIGRTFKESIQKALRSLEIGARGFGGGGKLGGDERPDDATIKTRLGTPNAERIFYIRYAFRAGYTVEQIFELTKIDPWFLHHLREIHEMEEALAGLSLGRHRHGADAPGQAVRLLGRAARAPPPERPGLGARRAQEARDQDDLPAGRHLRRGIRGVHALLLFQLRRRERGDALGESARS